MSPNKIKHSFLQSRLIQSLESITQDPKNREPQFKRLLNVITHLKNAYIPGNDYQTVFNYTFLLTAELPDIMKHPHNQMLQELGLDCLTQLALTVELRKKSGR